VSNLKNLKKVGAAKLLPTKKNVLSIGINNKPAPKKISYSFEE